VSIRLTRERLEFGGKFIGIPIHGLSQKQDGRQKNGGKKSAVFIF
jgi:hypothetical protein